MHFAPKVMHPGGLGAEMLICSHPPVSPQTPPTYPLFSLSFMPPPRTSTSKDNPPHPTLCLSLK